MGDNKETMLYRYNKADAHMNSQQYDRINKSCVNPHQTISQYEGEEVSVLVVERLAFVSC